MKNWEDQLKNKLNSTFSIKEELSGRASVIVPIGFRSGAAQYEILLTKRTQKVETHKGQISFPGGFFEISDKTLLETALREAYEEVGLQRERIRVLGRLEPVATLGGVVIYPWVAHVDFPDEFLVNPEEVERTVFLSLDRLLSEGLQLRSVLVKRLGVPFHVESPGIECDGELIWGASAKILQQLYFLLKNY